jgi:hypothetical protein
MRKRVFGAALAVCALVPVAIAAQQTVRFNDAVALDHDEPPLVSVWIEGGTAFRFGQPIRVRYRVEEDAYVVVARVDWDGNLTILHPAGRNRQALVRGGTDHTIHSNRLGGRGTFVANERNGGTGYVFALASYAPFDLSRLSQRDFSAWVTGIALGQPTSRYVGDPDRVIARFSQLVVWDPDTTWDYDVEFYSVDSPSWVSTASAFEETCFSSRSRRGYGYSAYGYDPYRDGSYDFGYSCAGIPWGLQSCALSFSQYSWSMGFPIGCLPYYRRPQVAHNPPGPPPVTPPGKDSVRVNPWAPESIGRPNVDQRGAVNGPHRMTVEPAVAPVAVGGDGSYSIPRRALERMRDRGLREGRPTSEPGGPMPMPARPAPVTNDQPSIEWVRPPRAMAPVNRDRDPGPPRRGAREDRGESRGSARSYDPPPRTASPAYERERQRPSDNGRGRSGSSGAVRHDPPPRVSDRSPEVRSSPPPPAPPRVEQSRPPATERKPAERKPAEERKP